jgi:hypothetical protein
MGGHEARGYWEHVGLTRLLAGVLLPPLAWALDLQVSYALVKWSCATGWHAGLWIVPALSLSLVAAAAWHSWGCWTALRQQAAPAGAAHEDRSYFLAVTGLALAALFALLIVTSALPRALLSPCE